ncbi:MAG: phosphatase PAP2 family protein [Nanoarchaeota archaeon]
MKADKNKIIISILVICLFAISFFFDKTIFLFIDLIENPVLDYILNIVSSYTFIFLIFFLATLSLWKENKQKIPLLWSSIIISTIITIILKVVVARARPFDATIISILAFLNYSFPSLHSATAFSIVPALDKFKWAWIILAIIIAISRIYLKVHYLSDVLFGAILGYLVGFGLIYLEKRYKIFKR